MKHWTLPSATAVALILSAGAGLAVTPEEVWENWKLAAGETGTSVTAGSETRNGAVLEIRDLQTTSHPQNGAGLAARFDSLTLTDLGDGRVRVGFPEVIEYEYNEPGALPGKPTAVVELRQPGADIIASGTAEAVRYDYSLPEARVTLTAAHDAGGMPLDLQLTLNAQRVTGYSQQSLAEGGGYKVDSDFSFGPIQLAISGNAPDGGGSFSGTGSLAGVRGQLSGTFLPEERMKNLSAALADGFRMDLSSEIGALALDLDMTEAGETGKALVKLDKFETNVLLDAARLGYGLSMLGGDFRVTPPGERLPEMTTAFSEATLRAAMPVGVSVEAGDFALLTKITDLTVSDTLWTMFDPAMQLARDPASLIVDVAGKGAWLTDIFNRPAADPLAVTAPPARVDSLDLKEVLLQLVGASVAAKGALSFDNHDLETFQGFPAPTGKITVNLAGVSVLLDKLVALGFVRAEDLTGVRMGLAMFTRPGAGPDQLLTEIEFRDKGLFVNGQQLM